MMPALNHIGLAVANLTAAVSWYHHNFGLQPYPQVLSVRKAESPDHPIFQLNSNVENVDIAFIRTSNGVGIEFFQFGRQCDKFPSLEGDETNIEIRSNELLDRELSGIFHFALTVPDPVATQARIHKSGGDALGVAIPVGSGGIATYSRDPMGNIVESIDCEFEEITKHLFEV